MRQRLLVLALLLITAAYCWGLGWIAWGFARAESAVGWGLALCVVLLLGLTVWVTWREVLFGLSAARLTRRYEPAEDIDPDPRQEFESARAEIRRHEGQGRTAPWQGWFRLALAYNALHDRREARRSTRRAIATERMSR